MKMTIKAILFAHYFLCFSFCNGQEFDYLEEEKKVFSRIDTLVSSSNPKERAEGADMIVGMNLSRLPFSIIEKVALEQDPNVRVASLDALFVSVGNGSVNNEEAIKIETLLEEALIKEKGLKATSNSMQLMVLAREYACLNELRMHHPLMSIIEFIDWQHNEYFDVVLNSISSDHQATEDSIEIFTLLFMGLREPEPLRTLMDVIKEIDRPERNRILKICRKHPVVGEGRPMGSMLGDLYNDVD